MELLFADTDMRMSIRTASSGTDQTVTTLLTTFLAKARCVPLDVNSQVVEFQAVTGVEDNGIEPMTSTMPL